MRRSLQLVVAAGLAFVAMLLVVLEAPQPLRAVAGLLLVLVLPGTAIVATVFRRTPWPAERSLVVVASSIAVVILGGIVLDRFDDGLTTISWAVFLAYATVGLFVFAAVRPRPRAYRLGRLRGRPLPPLGLRQALLIAAAALLAVVAVGIAHAGADDARRAVPLVQLWMVQTRNATTTRLDIGVDAANAETQVYRLEVRPRSGSPTIWQVPVEGVTNWRAIVEIPRGTEQRVDAALFTADDPDTAVRQVRQWVR